MYEAVIVNLFPFTFIGAAEPKISKSKENYLVQATQQTKSEKKLEKKIEKKSEKKVIEEKTKSTKEDKTPEKVELSVITDNTQIKAQKGDPNEPLQFKVSVKKSKDDQFRADFTSPTGRSNVFTGMSPMRPKLRSSMNELMKRSADMTSKKLQRVEYTTEHVVKLPWPNDSNEDAAWVSGHHLCLTNHTGTYIPSLCFLCGSAGEEKVKHS